MILAIPLTKKSGPKTTTVVNEDATRAIPTSDDPETDALMGSAPSSTCLTTFSNTTIALSTTIPPAMARLMRDTTLIVYPIEKRPIKAAIMEKGMVNVTSKLVRMRRRKTKQTITTNMPPAMADLAKVYIIL